MKRPARFVHEKRCRAFSKRRSTRREVRSRKPAVIRRETELTTAQKAISANRKVCKAVSVITHSFGNPAVSLTGRDPRFCVLSLRTVCLCRECQNYALTMADPEAGRQGLRGLFFFRIRSSCVRASSKTGFKRRASAYSAAASSILPIFWSVIPIPLCAIDELGESRSASW